MSNFLDTLQSIENEKKKFSDEFNSVKNQGYDLANEATTQIGDAKKRLGIIGKTVKQAYNYARDKVDDYYADRYSTDYGEVPIKIGERITPWELGDRLSNIATIDKLKRGNVKMKNTVNHNMDKGYAILGELFPELEIPENPKPAFRTAAYEHRFKDEPTNVAPSQQTSATPSASFSSNSSNTNPKPPPTMPLRRLPPPQSNIQKRPIKKPLPPPQKPLIRSNQALSYHQNAARTKTRK